MGRHARRPFLRARSLYRRSIQFRVVAATLVLTLGVVLMLGAVVIGQVRNGLLDAKRDSAFSQARGGFQAAQTQTSTSGDPRAAAQPDGAQDPTGTGTGTAAASSTWLNNLVEQLAVSGQGQYAVVALSDAGTTTSAASDPGNARAPRASGGVDPRSISRAIQSKVRENTRIQWQYTKVYYDADQNRQPTSGLAVGKQLYDTDGHAYQLYYLFNFGQEEKTLSLVKGTLATAGVFVVVLMGAIAWLVVRQAVTPVRMAAKIVERLASGKLDERMKVTGEDDIALLGESFNKMASHLQSQIRQLEGLSRMQRRFVSDVSHELRTPLTTVRMAADLLYESRDEFDPMTQRSAELLQQQLDRFESLLGDLLEISRFDAGAAVLDAEPVDLREIARRVIESAAPLAQHKDTRVLTEGDRHPVVAEVDPRRIERILRNLVVNAIEHGEGRDVVIRLAAGDGAVAIAVRDHGVGLKPGESSRVFNRFWRADPARARTTGGTGLGLSIAQEDAHLHGGWLQAWGEPGGGSQFRLTLPRQAGGDVVHSPLPLEPEDSTRNRGVRAAGVPFRRSGGAARPDGAEPHGQTGTPPAQRRSSEWATPANGLPSAAGLAVSPSGVGGTVSRRVGPAPAHAQRANDPGTAEHAGPEHAETEREGAE
ncbi:two-component sensor histidine kinase [Mangrovactinospora gilvigrisea]|uniref:Sensor histidine kinase MtrB n=1 Tax=Mangrovactinospora gilvigrisea TaxID=1428644 RepID=A0A1J7BVU6_9ACTN|nr:two-component sensor histidine kinase [Mangrovactinospora gilvigrisea]